MQTNPVMSSNSVHYSQQREKSLSQPVNREGLDEATASLLATTTRETEKTNESEKKLSNEETKSLLVRDITHMNEMLKTHNTSLKFNLHEDTERYYVQVVDQSSEKVIREIPDKEFLDMISKMMNYMGILVDKKI